MVVEVVVVVFVVEPEEACRLAVAVGEYLPANCGRKRMALKRLHEMKCSFPVSSCSSRTEDISFHFSVRTQLGSVLELPHLFMVSPGVGAVA